MFEKPFVMKKGLSSFYRAVSSGESCGICAFVITIVCVVVVWQVIGIILHAIQDHVALQSLAYWRPGN